MARGIIFANPPAVKREGQQRRGMFPLPLVALANSLDDTVSIEQASPDLLPTYGQAAEVVAQSDAEWVAITCYQETMHSVVQLARIAKQSGKKVVVGGHHVTICGGKSVLQEIPEVDYAVVGEGETPLKMLMENADPHLIPNLWWRENKQPTTNKLPVYYSEWTDLPPMIRGYTAFNFANLWERIKATGRTGYQRPFSVIGIRGCAYAQRSGERCSICAIPRKNVLRCRDPQHFWREIMWAVRRYHVDLIWEHSDSFLGMHEWLARLAECRPAGTPPIWCYGRADEIDTASIDLIASVGVEHIYIGVEAGSDERIQVVKKNITLDQVRNAIQLCRQRGIKVQPSFIIGLPGETRESISDTIHFALECRERGADDVVFHEFILRRGLKWFGPLVERYPQFNRVVIDQGELQRLCWSYYNPTVSRDEALAMTMDTLGKFPHSELTAWNI